MVLTLILSLVLLAQPSEPRTVAIITGPEQKITIMEVSEAEALYARLLKDESDPAMLAAVTIALGTVQVVPGLPNTRERRDWEIRRGVRRALQAEKMPPE